jgi:GntR family transcriptional regulator
MYIQIEHISERPVYRQIMDQIKLQIAQGKLLRGDKLPTVRELAERLVINPNTIAKAYRLLEREGVIATRIGSGTFVAQRPSQLSMEVREKLICQELKRVIVESIHLQIPKEILMEWFERSLEGFIFGRESESKNERDHTTRSSSSTAEGDEAT